ncbi:hypothetical protein CLOAM1623 [Candidatus Cloacimonas acidaminovorans str. Evry]|uniref:Uncharacterized protein n=1 Tax=Cloacimonas acidaminovorans (strain Evry) TaxID=459349 RepID=B0VG06_CLOAI|nr:hypothetical protein CLOAM1623 [Candidatus Cloacimonas acidaminovorans str. Evry]
MDSYFCRNDKGMDSILKMQSFFTGMTNNSLLKTKFTIRP